ncbi:hypothetical protein [Acaryochloris sp. IP29b_bin.137]|uniref:hypothetical protein n=1 Tax=Acaryochloris sp. IP29b_bin.137 TaxID=2969217 RepID=UPI002605A601|nr:hypothetical protein [Acaryochloris sp. IP29b_bin.137]
MKKLSLLVLLAGAAAAFAGTSIQTNFSPQTQINAIQAQRVSDPDSPERPQAASTTMDQLAAILREEATDVQVEAGQISFKYEGRTMLILTSAQHDRMRIIAPIQKATDLTSEQRDNMLLANFHTALDGRYAVSNGIVFATFLHPLSTLHEQDFRSALSQVHQLVQNFGTTYSSGALGFGAGQEKPEPLPAI